MKNESEKVEYVVADEHTIGYINPERPHYIVVLHSSILRGAIFELSPGPKLISLYSKIRPATSEDFETYRISQPKNLV